MDRLERYVRLVEEYRRDPKCGGCECLQGLVMQLIIDAASENARQKWRSSLEGRIMHPCLGCDPCPPAEAHARYLRERKSLE